MMTQGENGMETWFIGYRKRGFKRTIRIEFAIQTNTKEEARTIATKEAVQLPGYRYDGVN